MKLFGRFTLGKKIALGYTALLAITLASCLYSITTFKKNQETDKLLVDLYQPSITALVEVRRLIARSNRLTNNWIYQPSDDQTTELRNIHEVNFPEVRQQLVVLKVKWSPDEHAIIDEIFEETAFLFDTEKKIMAQLNSKGNYFDSEIIQSTVADLEQTVSPTARSLEIKISSLIQLQERAANLITEQKFSSFTDSQRFITLSLIASFLVGTVFAIYSIRVVVKPVNQLRNAVLALGKGELEEISIEKPDDEIGDMIESTNLLVSGLKKTTDFTEKIAAGKFEEEHSSLSNIQALDDALFRMRDSLISVAKVEEKRKWVISGLANFSEVLRKQDGITSLGESVIFNLVKYLEAHHGGIFIVNNNDAQDPHLQLTAAYAWDSPRLAKKRISMGEGFVGQCWKDGQMIHLTQVTDSVMSTQSGLMQYFPSNVIIFPLKVNDVTFGVVELSSFKPFDQYALKFLEEVCKNVAAAMMSAINAFNMERLLQQSQDQTEQLRGQEEEMRQMLEQSLFHTEQLRAQEEELRQNQEQLEETIKINSKLLSVISHDIKGPFATLKGLIQLYNGGLIAHDELRPHMKNMETLVNSTDMLFSNILQWSVYYMDNRTANKQEIDLSLVVFNNVSLLLSAAKAKGIELINNVDSRTLLFGDESIINLVLRNLISNAIKFTEDGTITISAKKNGNEIEVSVQDTGMGMSPKEMSSLFSWETKHSTMGTRAERGAGVGLLICKEFIENIGGRLYCNSQKGVGTVFSFSLPSAIMNKLSA